MTWYPISSFWYQATIHLQIQFPLDTIAGSSRRLSFSGDKSGLSSDMRTLNNTTDAEMDELEEEAMVSDVDKMAEDKKKVSSLSGVRFQSLTREHQI